MPEIVYGTHLNFIRIRYLEDSQDEVFQGMGASSGTTAIKPTTKETTAATTKDTEKASGILGALIDLAVMIYDAYDVLVNPPVREMSEDSETTRGMKSRSLLPVPISGGWLVRLLSKVAGAAGGPVALIGMQLVEHPDIAIAVIQFGELLLHTAEFIVDSYDKYNENDDRERMITIFKNGLLHLPPGVEDKEANYVSTFKKGLLELVNDPETNEETLTAYLSGIFDLAMKEYVLKFADNMELYTKAMALKY
jgi:hypothetical protein